MNNKVLIFFITHLITFNNLFGQNLNPDPLSETPLYPIPTEMTYEEYGDMNRRLSQAFLWSAVPIPGSTHYYAGEKKVAKRLFYIGLGGFALFIGGAIANGDASWPDYDENNHIIHNVGTDDERRFKKIPISMQGDIINYDLLEIYKEGSGDGSLLMALGAIVLLGDFIYDRLKGIHLVEEKRNQVRYKYGQLIEISYKPTSYYSNRNNQISMKLNFDL